MRAFVANPTDTRASQVLISGNAHGETFAVVPYLAFFALDGMHIRPTDAMARTAWVFFLGVGQATGPGFDSMSPARRRGAERYEREWWRLG